MFEEVDQAVTKRMDYEWNLLHPTIPILYENIEVAEGDGLGYEDGEAHIDLEILDGESDRIDLGNVTRSHRYPGFININIYGVKGEGVRDIKELADSAASIFRDQQFNGVSCWSASITKIGPSGGYFQYNVSIPFYADFRYTHTLD